MRALRWLPVPAAAAYVLTVAVLSPRLIDHLYWDTDVSAPFVLAERLRGHGDVFIPHYGSWSVLWLLLATRHLAGHRELWEALGYPLAVSAVALVGWATARVAGLWAGVTAGATTLVVGPHALRSQLTLIFHVLPPFGAAVLAAYLVFLGRAHSRRAGAVVAVVVGLVAGATAASDALLWVAGVAPFAIAAAILVLGTRRRDVAAQATLTVGVAVLSAIATDALMRALDYRIVGLELHRTQLSDLDASARHLGRMLALLGGANYALPGGYPREPLRIIVALLAVVAVAAAVAVAVRELRRRGAPIARAYTAYWASSVVLLGASFVVTTNARSLGAGSANYLLPFALAAGAGVGLLAVSLRAQAAAGAAVAFVAAVNAAGIAHGHADTPREAVGTYAPRLVHILEAGGVRRGYAGYWDAQNLTWQSGMRLLVAPVEPCGDALCAFNFSVIDSWYRRHEGPSFLIVDPERGPLVEPPPFVRDARASYRFGSLRLYVFDYDVAGYIRPPGA
jgi:hypothetical protein